MVVVELVEHCPLILVVFLVESSPDVLFIACFLKLRYSPSYDDIFHEFFIGEGEIGDCLDY